MKLFYFLIGFFLIAGVSAQAQYSRYVVQFKDKKGNPYSISNPSAYLSAKAIARRTRYNISIDSTDLPITPAYIDSIQSVPNVIVLNKSKWLNQLCIQTTDAAALTKINSFSFVNANVPVSPQMNPFTPPISKKFDGYNPVTITSPPNVINGAAGVNGAQDYYNYGNNFGQIHIHEGEYLHNLGFHGEGMTIAMLDAGFQSYTINPLFDSIRLQNQILGTWDYVNNEPSVAEDHPHGAWCLSVMAANKPGAIVGTAPKAKYWLLRTENAATEYPIEEQNWLAGAEFADSTGADIITSSLGYSDFDDASFNHAYAQRDGKTAIISKAATIAVQKGILVTNSAGNSGRSAGDAKYVICPADAEAVLTIGATDVNGNIASFSSWGPNGAGKLKPDVVSVGAAAVVGTTTSGNTAFLNGTSFSNPNLCGLVACLWQAFPEFKNTEIVAAVEKSSSKYNNPDNRFGYGIPNMRIAYQLLQQEKIIKNYQQALGNKWIKAFPVPFSDNLTVLLKAPVSGNCSLRLIDMNGKTIEQKTSAITQDVIITVSFNRLKTISRGVYTIQYNDGKNKTTLRVVKQ
jgi:serine protease AprX